MSEQPWFLSPAGWLQGIGATIPGIPGYATAMKIGARPIETLFSALQTRFVGRRIETSLAGRPLAFTVKRVDARFDPLRAALGQADDVRFIGEDLEFDGLRATRITVMPRHVHTRLGIDPVLVAAPVDVEVDAGTDQVQELLRRNLGMVDVELLGGPRARIRSAGSRSHRGWLNVDLAVEDGRVELRPTEAGWGDSGLRRRLRTARAIPMPTALGDQLRIVDIAVDDDKVSVTVRIDEWSVASSKLLSF